MPNAKPVSLVLCGCTRRGISFNQYFGDFSNYTNAWLHQHLLEGEDAHPGLALSVESWRRQRQYIEWALEVWHCCSQAVTPLPPLVAVDAVFVRGPRNTLHLVQCASLEQPAVNATMCGLEGASVTASCARGLQPSVSLCLVSCAYLCVCRLYPPSTLLSRQ